MEKGEETEAELELWWPGEEGRREQGGRKAERGAQGWQPWEAVGLLPEDTRH